MISEMCLEMENFGSMTTPRFHAAAKEEDTTLPGGGGEPERSGKGGVGSAKYMDLSVCCV